MKENKLFIIHTEGNKTHKNLYHELVRFLKKSGFYIWEYGDWAWSMPDEKRFPRIYPFLSPLERLVYKSMARPKIIEGGVNIDGLEYILKNTEAIIIFDMEKEEITSGMLEEIFMLNPDRLDFSRFFGSIGVVQFGDPKWISKRYSRIVSGMLNLGPTVESSVSDKLEIQVKLLSLFSAKLIIQSVSRKRNEFDEERLEMISDYLEKTKKLLDLLGIDFIFSYYHEVSKFIEILMSKIHECLSVSGKKKLEADYPGLLNWIINEFDGACLYQDMSEKGLARVIEILETLGSPALDSLQEIYQEPYCTNKPEERIYSMNISYYVVKAISKITGESWIDILSKEIADSSSKNKWIAIGTLGTFAKYSSNKQIKSEISKLLSGILKDENSSAQMKEFCIEALEDCTLQESEALIRTCTHEEEIENVRRSAILFLMRLLGEKASPIVVDFLENASLDSCRFIASAAWRVNTDELYEALSKKDLREDEDIRANLLYSLVRAKNRRAPRITLEGLSSKSDHLRAVASSLASDCIERCSCTPKKKKMIIVSLKSIVNRFEGETKLFALFSLLRLGEEEFKLHAEEILDKYLTQGEYELAATILEAGGVGLNNWPKRDEVRKLLFHSSDDIRLIMTYIIGYQQREDFLEDLECLKEDTSIVYPKYYENSLAGIMGRSVSEGASIAIGRIKGRKPLQKANRFPPFD